MTVGVNHPKNLETVEFGEGIRVVFRPNRVVVGTPERYPRLQLGDSLVRLMPSDFSLSSSSCCTLSRALALLFCGRCRGQILELNGSFLE